MNRTAKFFGEKSTGSIWPTCKEEESKYKQEEKLLLKEDIKVNGGKVENSSRIADGSGRLPVGENNMQKPWNEYFEDLCNVDTELLFSRGSEDARKCNQFGGEQVNRAKMKIRLKRL